jgi:hypothetical protein
MAIIRARRDSIELERFSWIMEESVSGCGLYCNCRLGWPRHHHLHPEVFRIIIRGSGVGNDNGHGQGVCQGFKEDPQVIQAFSPKSQAIFDESRDHHQEWEAL